MTRPGCILTCACRWARCCAPGRFPRGRHSILASGGWLCPSKIIPLSAGEFEGVHEGQSRGTGAVIIWDEGMAEIVRDEPDRLSFSVSGHKLAGRFSLIRTGQRRWLLIKVRDDYARAGSDIVAECPASVRSGRTWQELAAGAEDGAGMRAAQQKLRTPGRAPGSQC